MSIYIQRFIDRVPGVEARGGKDYTMSIVDAKGLYADITHLLLELNTLRQESAKKDSEETIIEIKMDGGSF